MQPRNALVLLVAPLLATSYLCAQACLPHAQSLQTLDNVVNNGSPFIALMPYGGYAMLYDDHNSRTLYGDFSPNSSGNPQQMTSTLGSPFAISTSTYLNDVGGAVFQSTNTFVADFINTGNQVEIIAEPASGGAYSWTYQTAFTVVQGLSVNANYTPALVNFNNQLYMAFVSGSSVNVAYSSNLGINWTLLSTTALSPSTISRPTLAVYNNNIYIAYTTTGGTVVSGTLLANGNWSPSLTTNGFALGYKNNNGYHAGVALVPYNGALYLEGQSTQSSQYLYSTDLTSGIRFPSPVQCAAQLRWTPSGAAMSNGSVDLVFQSAFNTQIWTQYQ